MKTITLITLLAISSIAVAQKKVITNTVKSTAKIVPTAKITEVLPKCWTAIGQT